MGKLAAAGSQVLGFGNGQVIKCQTLAVVQGLLAQEHSKPKFFIYGIDLPIIGSY